MSQISIIENFSTILSVLDYVGTFVFGATGALAAANKKHDIITFIFFAAITGVGGGTLRDLLIGAPVFWINKPEYIMICVSAAIFVWLLGQRGFRFKLLNWLDAIGIAAFCVVGANRALEMQLSPFIAIVMGVLTAVCGGIIRDAIANEPSMILRREIYVTSCLIGSIVFVLLHILAIDFWISAFCGFLSAFAIRAAAIIYGLQLPGFSKSQEKL